MSLPYHILNGDVLKEQLSGKLDGEFIVIRECLVDGEVSGDLLDDFFNVRAKFISKNYPNVSERFYFESTVPEFKKLFEIPSGSTLNLWFEDDLFCQVNLWFVLHLLQRTKNKHTLYLVRPENLTPFGFGALSAEELISRYHEKTLLTNLDDLACLWPYYSDGSVKELLQLGQRLNAQYPFIAGAIVAHKERLPTKESPGRPQQTLMDIMAESHTISFQHVYSRFCEREPIYGYSDIMVTRLIQTLESGNLGKDKG